MNTQISQSNQRSRSSPQDILESFFGAVSANQRLFNGERPSEIHAQAYYDYYQRQWEYFFQDGAAAFCEFNELRDIVNDLTRTGTRKSVLLRLRNSAETKDNDATCESVVDFAARLATMMRIGSIESEVGRRSSLSWESSTLKDFVNSHLTGSTELISSETRLPKSLDAWSVHNVAGIKIQFTENINDHLRLIDYDTILLVFHHASFLELQRLGSSSCFPEDFVTETLKTLALLFPQAEYSKIKRSNSKKINWLRKLRDSWVRGSGCSLDIRISQCGTLQADDRQIGKFWFWRDRLVILKECCDMADPGSLKQWWYNREKPMQWCLFWAGLVFFFVMPVLALIQVIEGALQIYVSYSPNTRS